MSDQQKKKRAAVQLAWRMLIQAVSLNEADPGLYIDAYQKLEAAFPEYLGGA